jgi:hypothetical protein
MHILAGASLQLLFSRFILLGQNPSGQFRDVIYGDASNSLCNSTNANYKMATCLLER